MSDDKPTCPPVQTSAETVDWVRRYAEAGYHPIELRASSDVNAKSPGKQPTNFGWQKEPNPLDPSTYSPIANVGLRTGLQSSGVFLVAVDVDDPAGLFELAADWPETLVNETRPGERFQLLYHWPADLPHPKNSVKAHTASGRVAIDVRAQGGQIAVHPSTHPATGKQYRWAGLPTPVVLPLETARAILDSQSRHARSDVSSARGPNIPLTHTPSTPADPSAGVPTLATEGLAQISASRFVAVCRRLAKKDLPVARSFELLARGCAFAEPGERDDTIWRMCWHLAGEIPGTDPQAVEAQFQTALSVMHAISPFKAPADVAAKFARAVASRAAESTVVLIQSSTGGPVACQENILRVLRGAPEFVGAIGYDLFAARIVWTSPAPWHKAGGQYPRGFADHESTLLAAHLMAKYRLNVRSTLAFECLAAMAWENSYHPVREYLERVAGQWDGQARLDTWLSRYTGCPDNEYTRKVSAWWLMQGVARVASPGCQADYVLVLEGPQGRRKSSALETLASSDWFLPNLSDFRSKDAMVELAGRWVVELAELTGLKSEVNVQKSFLSRRSDHYRAPYARVAESYPRQCIFAGSTNDYEYLQDTTGNRRFWPIRCSDAKIDREALEAERDQLWAEACVRLAMGEHHWPESDAEDALFAAEVESRRVRDSWEGRILGWMRAPIGLVAGEPVTQAWVLDKVLDVGISNRSHDSRVASCLRVLGWTRSTGGGDWLPPAWVQPVAAMAPVVPLRVVGAGGK